MQRFVIFVLVIYLFDLLFGVSFALTAIELGLVEEISVFLFMTFLPLIFILIYFFRYNLGNLSNHEKALHYLMYLSLAVSLGFTSLFIIPTLYV